MTKKNGDINFDKIVCQNCNTIHKIQIITNWKKKDITVQSLCEHIKNGIIEEKKKEFLRSKYNFLNKNDVIFYCQKHYKKLNGYCDKFM